MKSNCINIIIELANTIFCACLVDFFFVFARRFDWVFIKHTVWARKKYRKKWHVESNTHTHFMSLFQFISIKYESLNVSFSDTTKEFIQIIHCVVDLAYLMVFNHNFQIDVTFIITIWVFMECKSKSNDFPTISQRLFGTYQLKISENVCDLHFYRDDFFSFNSGSTLKIIQWKYVQHAWLTVN